MSAWEEWTVEVRGTEDGKLLPNQPFREPEQALAAAGLTDE